MKTVNQTRTRGATGHGQSKKRLNAQYIKGLVNPLEFYRSKLPDNVPLNKHTWNSGGLCPFHDDRTAGSFHVNLVSGGYKCFSCGASGGDIISFTMTRYGLQFNEALAKLADDWGLI